MRRCAISPMPVRSSTSSTAQRRRVERGHHRDDLAHGQIPDQRAGLQHRADRARRRSPRAAGGRRRRPCRRRARRARAACRSSSTCRRRSVRAARPSRRPRSTRRRRAPPRPGRTTSSGPLSSTPDDGRHGSTVPRATAQRGAVNRPIASTASLRVPRRGHSVAWRSAAARASGHVPRRPERGPAAGRHDDRGAGARDRRRGLGQDARAHLPRRASAEDAGRRAERAARDHVHEQGRAGDARAHRRRTIGPRARAIWILTFHAACGRILRREAERLGYRSNFTIYDSADQIRLVKDCLTELDRDPKRFTPRGIHTQISNAKNQLIGPDEYACRVASFYDQTVADVYGLYQRRLFASNAVDFDDLLMLTVDVLQRFPEARDSWAKRFRYVLVDEYQDTNHAQYVLLKLLPASIGTSWWSATRTRASTASAGPTSATSSSSSATSPAPP